MPVTRLATPPAPRHVAIIMDGNGRWARARGKPRVFGHRAGVEAVRRAVNAAGDLGIRHLTLFGFSTENWSRPREEVNDLLGLMRRYVDEDLKKLADGNVRVQIVGSREDLSDSLLEILDRAESRTAHCDGFNLNIAFNYGGRDEILRATRAAMRDVEAGRLRIEDLNEERFDGYLDTAHSPPVDLLIRTSGEERISNFLLWQLAYAELVFLDVLWPDFDLSHFSRAVDEFAARERRFGGVVRADAE